MSEIIETGGGTVLGNLTLSSGGTGTLTGSGSGLQLGSGTTAGKFTNAGTLTDNTTAGSDSLYLTSKSVFNNQGSYTLSPQSAGIYSDGPLDVMNNSGTFTVNGGTGTDTYIYPTFNNSGTVNVSSGTLTLGEYAGTATQSGSFNLA